MSDLEPGVRIMGMKKPADPVQSKNHGRETIAYIIIMKYDQLSTLFPISHTWRFV